MVKRKIKDKSGKNVYQLHGGGRQNKHQVDEHQHRTQSRVE